MDKDALTGELQATQFFFHNSTKLLEEQHASYAPTTGSFTVLQQVAHVAHTIDWFVEGAFRPEGFDTDWEAHQRIVDAVPTLAEARAWVDRAFDGVVVKIKAESDDSLCTPMPDGPIMGGQPRLVIVGAVVDHTAHHRGALTVYQRLLGLTPPMPYLDD